MHFTSEQRTSHKIGCTPVSCGRSCVVQCSLQGILFVHVAFILFKAYFSRKGCNLCLKEKFLIIYQTDWSSLNKRNEALLYNN